MPHDPLGDIIPKPWQRPHKKTRHKAPKRGPPGQTPTASQKKLAPVPTHLQHQQALPSPHLFDRTKLGVQSTAAMLVRPTPVVSTPRPGRPSPARCHSPVVNAMRAAIPTRTNPWISLLLMCDASTRPLAHSRADYVF